MVKKVSTSTTKKSAASPDFQPTKIALLVSAVAAVSLVIVGLIATS